MSKLFGYVTGQAEWAINWYVKAAKPKRRGGWLLRLGAILATAAAGIVPILGEIFDDPQGRPSIAPGWAAIAVALAATLIALDKFWGFTSAWVRFVLAELDLRQGLEGFRMDWENDKLNWQGAKPTEKVAMAMLARARAFLLEVRTLVRRETDQWAAEFQTAIRQIDEASKAAAAKSQGTGAIAVQVTNGDACPEGWMLIIDGGAPQPCTGKHAAASSMTSGLHTVRVEGKSDGQLKHVEKPVSVSPGGITQVELTLG